MAAEQYYPPSSSEHEFGPAYFQPPETVKRPKGKHLRIVGHAAVAGEGLEKPIKTTEYPSQLFNPNTTQEQDAASLREGQNWLKEQEQQAMDAFHIEIPKHDELLSGQVGAKVFAIVENVLGAPAFNGRLVKAETATEVDFIDENGGPAVVIKEKLTRHDTLATIIDKTIDPAHEREVRVTASESNPDSVDVVVAYIGDTKEPITIDDPEKKARIVAEVLGDAAKLVDLATAVDSPRAAKLAREALNVTRAPALRPEDLRSYS